MSAFSELMDDLAALQAKRREDNRVIRDVLAKGARAARFLGRGDGARYLHSLIKALPKGGSDEPGLVANTRHVVAKDKKRPDLVEVLNRQIDEHIAAGRYHEARVLEAKRNRVRT